MRNKTLRYTLANLQDDSLSALNKALIPAMSTRSLPARMHTSSQVIQIPMGCHCTSAKSVPSLRSCPNVLATGDPVLHARPLHGGQFALRIQKLCARCKRLKDVGVGGSRRRR